MFVYVDIDYLISMRLIIVRLVLPMKAYMTSKYSKD